MVAEGEIIGRRFFDLTVRTFRRKLGEVEKYKTLAFFSPVGFTLIGSKLSLDVPSLSSSNVNLIYLRRFKPIIKMVAEDEDCSSYRLGEASGCLRFLGKSYSIEEIENKAHSCAKSACLDSVVMHSFSAILFIMDGKLYEGYLTLDHQEGATLL